MPLPTFIIPGAPKAGTTALWAILNQHPQVFMSPIKEPHFFTLTQRDMGHGICKPGPRRSVTYHKGIEWYEGLFEGSEGFPARGEASTHYFSAPDSAELIKRYLPQVKLIFLLRDPVERAYSEYWQFYKSAWKMPSFEEMVETNHPAFRYFVHVSSYEVHLNRFFGLFPRDQILLLLQADMKDDRQSTFSKIFEFLGVNPQYVPEDSGRRYKNYRVHRSRHVEELLTRMRYSWISHKLPDVVQHSLGRFRMLISRANSLPAHYPPMNPDLREALVPMFMKDISFVERVTGRELGEWKNTRREGRAA